MHEDEIAIKLIAEIISGARRVLGDDAVKTANEVNGLSVRQTGEITVTGEIYKIVGVLCREYEKAMQGKLVVDVVVRLNLRRGAG